MTETLERRLRRHQGRLAVRAWEYRQRNYARGVWFRLRRVLADAARAYVLTEADAQSLLAEGYLPEPIGAELEPAKTIIFVPAEHIARFPAAREIPVSLRAEMLEARCVALVRFPVALPPTTEFSALGSSASRDPGSGESSRGSGPLRR